MCRTGIALRWAQHTLRGNVSTKPVFGKSMGAGSSASEKPFLMFLWGWLPKWVLARGVKRDVQKTVLQHRA